MPLSTSSRHALWYAHGAALVLGGTALFPRLIPLPAEQLVSLRTAIAALLLLCLAILQRSSWTWLAGAGKRWLLLSGLLLGGHWWAYYEAIQRGGVGLAVVLVYSSPAMTVLLEAWLHRRRPAAHTLLAAAAVSVGVALVLLPSFGDRAPAPWAAGLALLAALLYALRNLLVRERLAQAPGLGLAGTQFAVVALAGLPSLRGLDLDASTWAWLLLFGSLFTALPHLALLLALQRLPTSTVALVASLEVPYAVLLAWWLLHEPPGAPLLAGGLCILGAAWLASRHVDEDARRRN